MFAGYYRVALGALVAACIAQAGCTTVRYECTTGDFAGVSLHLGAYAENQDGYCSHISVLGIGIGRGALQPCVQEAETETRKPREVFETW